MTRTRLVIVLAAVAELAFGVPLLIMRSRQRARPHDTPGMSAEATSPGSSSVDSAAPQRTGGSPALPSGITGEARAAGQAMLDKMLGRQAEMSAWADAERTRVKELEAGVEQLEQRIKDTDANLARMSQSLERMRSASSANGAEHESQRTAYNDLVGERNQLVQQYDKQYADYTVAVREFDVKIAEYERKIHDALPVPGAHR